MKLKQFLNLLMLCLATSLAFVSCSKDEGKNEEPVVVNEDPTDYTKLLAGDYNAVVRASSHGQSIETKGIVKVKRSSKNVISIDVPTFEGWAGTMVEPFTLPKVKVRRTGKTYVLKSAEQTVSITMGQAYPNSTVVSEGTVDKNGVLSMTMVWSPLPDYSIDILIKDARKVVK